MKTVLKTQTCASILGTLAWSAQADKATEGAIKARQSLMQVYSFNLGKLGAMAKGEADYDADLAAALAKNLLAAAQMDNRLMWPQGSGNDAYAGKTRALPAIWATYPKISEKSAALTAAVEKLAAEAGNGLDGIKANIGGVGGGCKGCHDDFRAPKS
jgi:cytochrome c556